jgi:hypothetical protein
MKFSYPLLAALLAALLTACDKPEPPTPGRRPSPIPPSYGVSPLVLSGQKNYRDSFRVQSEENWTLSIPSSAAWLQTDVTQATGWKTVYVTVQQDNMSGTEQAASLTFTRTGTTETLSTLSVKLLPYQAPHSSIVWSKLFGGTSDDQFSAVVRTPNGYLVAGNTLSTDGDINSFYGGNDCWIMQVDEQGAKGWQTILGGNGYESIRTIVPTPDGGCLVGGYTSSANGAIAMAYSMGDAWVAKLNNTGALQWRKILGGSGYESLSALVANADGSALLAISTQSRDADVTGARGYSDILLMKLNASGNVLWKKIYGGSMEDYVTSLIPTTNGYAFAGYTNSKDGDVSGVHGSDDFWVVRIDGEGTIVWQKALGGSYLDRATALVETTDGGYAVCGYTESKDGDVSSGNGYSDVWVVRLDASGKLVWQRSLGGSETEEAFAISRNSQDGLLLAGRSNSSNGPLAVKSARSNNFQYDAFVAELNKDGVLSQKMMLGGLYDEGLGSLVANGDNTFTLAGYSSSNDGDVSGKKGKIDSWIIKVKGW